MTRQIRTTAIRTLALAGACIIAALGSAFAVTMSVGPDQTLTYPGDLITLPDGHATFFPLASQNSTYLVFAPSAVTVGGEGGAVALTTSDLKTFVAAPGYANKIFFPPVAINTCNPAFAAAFDENYAAPGSVLQDPTRTAGNLIMLYEAENHCPGGTDQNPYYATTGFARSSDKGKTWPAPVNAEFGGHDRYPALKLASPEPGAPTNVAMGNAIPVALVRGNLVYVVYRDVPAPATGGQNAPGTGILRMARAALANDTNDHKLAFRKWYQGAFSQPGIGGLDSPIMPSAGCDGFQAGADLSWNGYLGVFLLVFVCESPADQTAAWYFSTTPSLATLDWSAPQLVANSEGPLTSPCPSGARGGQFDGFYPTLVTAGIGTGRTNKKGFVFFLNGCNASADRKFMRRIFTIAK